MVYIHCITESNKTAKISVGKLSITDIVMNTVCLTNSTDWIRINMDILKPKKSTDDNCYQIQSFNIHMRHLYK